MVCQVLSAGRTARCKASQRFFPVSGRIGLKYLIERVGCEGKRQFMRFFVCCSIP